MEGKHAGKDEIQSKRNANYQSSAVKANQVKKRPKKKKIK